MPSSNQMAGLGLLTGLLKGRAKKAQWEREQAEKKPMMDLQKQMLQLQLQNAKVKQQETAIKNNLINAMIQRWQAGQQQQGAAATEQPGQPATGDTSFGPSFGETGQKAPGLTDQMASMDPTIAALMQEMTGINFPAALSATQRERDYQLNKQRFEREGQKQVTMPATSPTGQPGVISRPQFAGPSQGQFIPTGPAELETYTFVKDGRTYEQIRNKTTKQDVGQPKEIKPISGETSETASKISLASNAINYTKQLRGAFIKNGSVDRKLILSANTPGGGMPGSEGRKLRAMFNDALDARARAATGAAMPESEIATYTRMYFPSILDNDTTVKDKLNRLEKFMSDYLEAMDPGGTVRKRFGNVNPDKTVVRTGTYQGRKVIQYSDGTIEYAD